jgi:hypothetical protein
LWWLDVLVRRGFRKFRSWFRGLRKEKLYKSTPAAAVDRLRGVESGRGRTTGSRLVCSIFSVLRTFLGAAFFPNEPNPIIAAKSSSMSGDCAVCRRWAKAPGEEAIRRESFVGIDTVGEVDGDWEQVVGEGSDVRWALTNRVASSLGEQGRKTLSFRLASL